MLKISKAIAVLMISAVPVAAELGKLDYGRIFRCGCSVDQVDVNVWRAYVWADYQDGAQWHDFALWLSQRGNRWKALKDCDDWLTSTHKKQAEVRKPKGRDSANTQSGLHKGGK